MAVLVIIALGFALAWGADDQRELNNLARSNCEQIEKLKTVHRVEAIQNYQHLEQNARILGIEVTPELRREARKGRDRTLQRFARSEC